MPDVPAAWRALARWVHGRPRAIVGVAAALTLLAAAGAVRLRVDADLWRLLPPEYASYRALDLARETVGGENPVEVILEGGTFDAARRLADTLVPAALALTQPDGTPYFTRAEYRRDVAFLADNALYFATDDELDTLAAVLRDAARDARRQANPLTRVTVRDSGGRASAERLEASLRRLVGSEYPVSPDSTVMVLRLHPSSSQGDLAFVEAAAEGLRQLVTALRPAGFHPALSVAIGGRFLQEQMEAAEVVRHVRWGSAVALPLILLIVVLYLGPRVPFGRSGWRRRLLVGAVVGVPLAMSVIWTYAVAWAAFGVLNIVTTTLALVLVGMGVDYGLHWLAAWTAERRRGSEGAEALARTYQEAAVAIAAGAGTTAAGLFALAVADFRAFREFGVLAGAGILLALAATLLVLPALAVLADQGGATTAPPPRPRRPALPRAWRLGSALLVTALAVVGARGVRFEYHSSALRPEFPAYQALRQKAELVPPQAGAGNPAIIVADVPEAVPALVARLRSRALEHDIIAGVEAMQDRVPMSGEAARQRLARVAEVRALLEGPVLGQGRSADLEALRRAAGTVRPIALDDVPASLVGPFSTRRGDLGRLVLVYPSRSLSDGRNSLAFAEAIGTVTVEDGRTYHAASMAIVAADMLRLMQSDGRRVLLLLGGGLLLAMLITFRSVRWAALSLVATVVGGLWLAGVMGASDLRLNLFNLAVLPVILGVGNDVGVHLVHAFRQGGTEGLGAARDRVAVAVLTTAAGFGALAATGHPGIASMGGLAVLGLACTLAAGLLIVPGLLPRRQDP